MDDMPNLRVDLRVTYTITDIWFSLGNPSGFPSDNPQDFPWATLGDKPLDNPSGFPVDYEI